MIRWTKSLSVFLYWFLQTYAAAWCLKNFKNKTRDSLISFLFFLNQFAQTLPSSNFLHKITHNTPLITQNFKTQHYNPLKTKFYCLVFICFCRICTGWRYLQVDFGFFTHCWGVINFPVSVSKFVVSLVPSAISPIWAL